MRASADRDDPGFRPDLIDTDIIVTLDGEVVVMPITADEQEGFVEFFTSGSDGEPFLDAEGQPAKQIRHGKVVIHLPPERWIATG